MCLDVRSGQLIEIYERYKKSIVQLFLKIKNENRTFLIFLNQCFAKLNSSRPKNKNLTSGFITDVLRTLPIQRMF